MSLGLCLFHLYRKTLILEDSINFDPEQPWELRRSEMYGSDSAIDDSERTAFRKSEKKYKLYYDNTKRKKHSRPVDLSEVIDFRSILESYNRNDELPAGVFAIKSSFEGQVFGLECRPGFYFIPGALSAEEQCQWIRESLENFPQPPNRTNHNAFYGPIENLFDAAKENKVLVEVQELSGETGSEGDSDLRDKNVTQWRFSCLLDKSCRAEATTKSLLASVLLRKLRWSTLGLQFDWSKRSYNTSLPHHKIPDALCYLAKRLAVPAMLLGEEFQPEAAIVNYFAQGDMLGGHLDDMEKDWSKPIVSMSLGCKAIFLLGGKSREDPPLAMFLRSGDVVLMAREARECFHGVPRIFTDKETAEIAHLELHFSNEDNLALLDYVRSSRININIRQVF